MLINDCNSSRTNSSVRLGMLLSSNVVRETGTDGSGGRTAHIP
jgi:hypothetical protein